MNSVILCEGETDIVILSKYLIHQYQFEFVSDDIFGVTPLIKNNKSEIMCNYSNPNNKLLIWAVGGKDNFQRALDKLFGVNDIGANEYYNRIIIFSDNDSKEEIESQRLSLNEIVYKYRFAGEAPAFEIGQWKSGKMKTKMTDADVDIETLLLAIPKDENGALETMLLKSFEAPSDKLLASKSMKFVEHLKEYKKEDFCYLSNRRDYIKAPLAVFFAVATPDRVFAKQNEILESISWEKFAAIRKELKVLDIFAIGNANMLS